MSFFPDHVKVKAREDKKAGVSVSDIAKEAGCSRQAVYNWIGYVGTGRHWGTKDYDEAIAFYKEGHPLSVVAHKFGINKHTLSWQLRYRDVKCHHKGSGHPPTPPATVARIIEMQQGGALYKDIAFVVGLGKGRVGQIIRQANGKGA